MQALTREPLTERRLSILGAALLIGAGTLFLPQDLFRSLPPVVQYVAGNGL